MKQNELQKQIRIGNHLLGKCIDDLDDRKEWWEIYKIQDAEHLMGIKNGWDKPIELTEEILLKCGLEKHSTNPFWFRKKQICISLSGSIELISWDMQVFKIDSKAEYLHQLQNLYFALTSEELEINL